MDWKIEQRLVCDRPDQRLSGCFVLTIDADSVTIFCPEFNLVVCGRQQSLERLGWRSQETALEPVTKTP